MEENTKNLKVVKDNNNKVAVKEPTIEELKQELMNTRMAYAQLKDAANKKFEEINYTNIYQQQQFMLELVKLHDIIGEEMTAKALNAIDTCWFTNTNENNGAEE